MKKTFVCSTDQFIVGGAESYTIRMMEWNKQNGNRNVLILFKGQRIAAKWREVLAQNDVEIYYIRPEAFSVPADGRGNKLRFNRDEQVTWIAYNVYSYINAYKMSLYYCEAKIHPKLYALHPFTLKKRCNTKVEQKLFDRFFYRIHNKNVWFMDDESRNYNEKVYNLSFKNPIIPIGMDLKDNVYVEEKNEKKCRILTVARLDFPIKGYVTGLIKDFEMLHKEYPDTTLTIVGDGPGRVKLENIISRLDDDTRNSVELAGSVDYRELGKYYDNCDLYLGQGTTLLEASLRGKIAIVQLAYQYTTISSGFFHNRPMFIGGELNNYSGKRYTALELMRQAMGYTREERKEYGETARKAVWDNYDITKTMKILMD